LPPRDEANRVVSDEAGRDSKWNAGSCQNSIQRQTSCAWPNFRPTTRRGRFAEYERYRVRALLIGISMGVGTAEEGVLGRPKGAIMIVDSRYPQLALRELATQIYLVDTQSSLPLAAQ
jgi:hypothetical protein